MRPFEREIDFDWDSEIDLSEESILEKTREICGLKEGGLGACVNPTFQSIAPALTGNPKLNPKMFFFTPKLSQLNLKMYPYFFLLQNCHNLTQKCTSCHNLTQKCTPEEHASWSSECFVCR